MNEIIKSPCVSVYKCNETNFRIDRKRNSDEITNWINYSKKMSEAILKDLTKREVDELSLPQQGFWL
ncbi:MAG: DUF1289 domain-containing protein [Proteobacteria bacterium]|nr:DUF1289 domain-containing protein [Pseudomonadota bacterium]MCH9712283.1 DUF1289 domain-containing protein [Pseudomonadota bacterium]MCH9749731.1 DUF1289 domain-containing protein [Pseudomonadota bacterium]